MNLFFKEKTALGRFCFLNVGRLCPDRMPSSRSFNEPTTCGAFLWFFYAVELSRLLGERDFTRAEDLFQTERLRIVEPVFQFDVVVLVDTQDTTTEVDQHPAPAVKDVFDLWILTLQCHRFFACDVECESVRGDAPVQGGDPICGLHRFHFLWGRHVFLRV